MQNQHVPVLIFAQSGRFLAHSATHAGYPVWVADCFGDQDTLSVAKRWHPLPVISELTEDSILDIFFKLTNGEKCTLICGSGIESCYTILEKLPDNIKLVGNNAHTIHTIKTPTLFFSLLDQLDIAHPDTQFKHPENIENWLVKSVSGLGGSHIQYLNQQSNLTGHYFQRFVCGISGSALFLANGTQAQLISINKQNSVVNEYTPFLLCSIESPWRSLSEPNQQQLERAIKKITLETGLIGLNSIDFILSEQDELLVLEINPRPSASAELINPNIPLFQYHLDACGGILPDAPIIQAVTQTSLRFLYADNNMIISSKITWPSGCHDLPATDTFIKKGEPVCTLIVQANSSQKIKKLLHDLEKKVVRQLEK